MNIYIKAALSAVVLICGSSYGALACTGVYVGRDVSQDGSAIIARTEDMESAASKRFIVHDSGEIKAGETYKDVYGFEVTYSHDSYRYSAIPGSMKRNVGNTPYGAGGFNEMGVAATATITAYPNNEAETADPFVYSGLQELSAADVILSQAATAKEGMEIIADIVDKQGCGEGSIIMTADDTEVWYMEIYTGHQYAAMKLPSDRAAVIPNMFMIGEFDVSQADVIFSKNLVSLAKSGNFLKETNGKINLRETYGEGKKDSNTIRVWGGRRILHGSVGDDPYADDYELLFVPSQKISVKEVMELTRYRYEDTKYNVNLPENKYVRAIGTSRQEECHILQLRKNLPVETANVMWLCMGNAEFAPYIPYYAAAIKSTPDMCRLDSKTYNPYSMYWSQRTLSTLCAQNRELYGNAVTEFYDAYENNLMKYLNSCDQSMTVSASRAVTATDFCYDISYDAFEKSTLIYAELLQFLASYEGADEFENNSLEFTISVSPEVTASGTRVTPLGTVIAN